MLTHSQIKLPPTDHDVMMHTSLCAAVRKWEGISASYRKDHPQRKWADHNLWHATLRLATIEKRILDRQFWL